MLSLENEMVIASYYADPARPERDPDEQYDQLLDERSRCGVCNRYVLANASVTIDKQRYHGECLARKAVR